MKRPLKLSLIALMLANTSVFALNPVQGWYGGLILGVSMQPTNTFTFVTPISTLEPKTASLTRSILGDVGGQIGYRCNHFRVEGELLYNNNPYDTLTVGNVVINSPSTSSGLRVQGDTNTGAFMANGFYDIYTPNQDNLSQVVPYVGVGVGYAYVQNSIQFYNNEVLVPNGSIKKSYSGPAGQIILGTSYFMDDFTTFGLDVRYFTTGIKSKTSPLGLNTFDTKTQLISVNLSFNGAFDFG